MACYVKQCATFFLLFNCQCAIFFIIMLNVLYIYLQVTISMAINGGLFEYAGKGVSDTQNAIDAEQQLANGQVTIGDKTYSSIDEYLDNLNETSIPLATIGTTKLLVEASEGVWENVGFKFSNEIFSSSDIQEGRVASRIYNYGQYLDGNASGELDMEHFVLVANYALISFPSAGITPVCSDGINTFGRYKAPEAGTYIWLNEITDNYKEMELYEVRFTKDNGKNMPKMEIGTVLEIVEIETVLFSIFFIL